MGTEECFRVGQRSGVAERGEATDDVLVETRRARPRRYVEVGGKEGATCWDVQQRVVHRVPRGRDGDEGGALGADCRGVGVGRSFGGTYAGRTPHESPVELDRRGPGEQRERGGGRPNASAVARGDARRVPRVVLVVMCHEDIRRRRPVVKKLRNCAPPIRRPRIDDRAPDPKEEDGGIDAAENADAEALYAGRRVHESFSDTEEHPGCSELPVRLPHTPPGGARGHELNEKGSDMNCFTGRASNLSERRALIP